MIPCEKCLIVPMCRHKHYYDLFDECKLLQEYEKDIITTQKDSCRRLAISRIESVLKPTRWQYVFRHDSVINRIK